MHLAVPPGHTVHTRRAAWLQLALAALSVLPGLIVWTTHGDSVFQGAALRGDEGMSFDLDVTWWLVLAVLLVFNAVVVYGAWRFLADPAAARVPFGISSALLLTTPPIGTVVGLYGLWVLTTHRPTSADLHRVGDVGAGPSA